MRFSGEREGDIYSRYTNPTIRIFEQRISALEYGERAVQFSGMAAILSICMALLSAGDHVVCSDVFGTTTSLFNKYLTKFGSTSHSFHLQISINGRNLLQDQQNVFFGNSIKSSL